LRRILPCFSVLAAALFASAAMAQDLPRADGAATPVKRYGPAGGCGPVMIFSPGFGGDENGGSYLATTMQRNGWRILVMGHRESGRQRFREAILSSAPRAGLIAAARDPLAHRARILDLDAAHAEATRGCRRSMIVLAGHSMGAMTTILEAGARATFGRLGGDRFDAYVAISPQGIGSGFQEGAWTAIAKPVLMITGTRDQAAEGGPETRLSAFEGLPPGRKRLAIIPDAGHIPLGANQGDAIGRTVASLTLEFLNGLQAGPRLPPSRLAGVEIRDK
jgi:pimeloyl-ACP methyl ester carboxylesterase